MRTCMPVGLLVVALSCCVGCSGETGPAPVVTEQDSPGPVEPDGWQATLVPVTFEAWQAELQALKGRIVVVDMWATWCLPCIERFPHMVQLAEEYSGRGVEFVSMCLDDREDQDSIDLARRFLSEQQARFPNYLMDEVVTQAFEKLDLLGIPAVFIYGPSGDLRYRLTGDDPNNQFTDADVNDAIEELLANG